MSFLPMPVQLTPKIIIGNPDFYSLHSRVFCKFKANWIKQDFWINSTMSINNLNNNHFDFDISTEKHLDKYYQYLIKDVTSKFNLYNRTDYANNRFEKALHYYVKPKWNFDNWFKDDLLINTLRKEGYRINYDKNKRVEFKDEAYFNSYEKFIPIVLTIEVEIWGMPAPEKPI
jgi:hypothetical protein